MTEIYSALEPGLGEISVRTLDPAADAAMLHGWVTEPRAEFWGMREHSEDEVREIYEYVDSLATHHAFLIYVNGEPQSLFQTYQPEHDPLGDAYPVQSGDLGIHLFLGPARPRNTDFTGHFLAAVLRWLFADSTVLRIVAEPDNRNQKAHRLFERLGFQDFGVVELPDKQALLMILGRKVWAATAHSTV